MVTFPIHDSPNLIITTLDLTGNKIQEISESNVERFSYLKTLILKNNILKEYPASVGKLKELNNLQLGGNNISSLDSMRFPHSLSHINLEKNSISDLPENI